MYDVAKDKRHRHWKKGWIADDVTEKQAPRWSFPHDHMHELNASGTLKVNQHVTVNVGCGSRATWVDKLVNLKSNPGPGHYRSGTAIKGVDNKFSEAIDLEGVNLEKSPKWSQGYDEREVVLPKLKVSISKPSNQAVPLHRAGAAQAAPGPCDYIQYTQFGAASGGSRKPYF